MTPSELNTCCSLLRRFLHGPLTRADQRPLVELIHSICRKDYSLDLWLQNAAHREGIKNRELFTSLCADLLGSGTSPGTLVTSLARHAHLCDAELFLHFERATKVLLRQALHRRFPRGGALSHQVRHYLLQIARTDPRIFLHKQRKRADWTALAGLDDLRGAKQPWSSDELKRIVFELDSEATDFRDLVIRLLQEVAKRTDRQAILEISLLVEVICGVKQDMAERNLLASSAAASDSALRKLNRKEAAKIVIKEIDCRLATTSISRGCNHHLESYRQALIWLMEDLVTYGDRDSHWKYLSRVLIGLTAESYRQNHRAFDDLAIWAKRRLAQILKESD